MLARKVLPVLFLMLACLAGTAHAETYSTEVINNIRVGQVAIKIDEYEIGENGEETVYADGKRVLPGQKVSKIVRITNLGNDAWIRIKANFEAEEENMLLSYRDLIIADPAWKRCGDYYYYTKYVPTGGHVDFISAVKIPTSWNESMSDKWTKIFFSSDAVQHKNFTPDFNSDDPWFGTMIEQRVYQPFEMKGEGDEKFSVEFRNGADGFVRVGDDFFNNWGTLLPGDTVEGTVLVGNNYAKAVEIFFHTETIADDDLLKKCILTIMNGDTVIYNGPLSGSLNEISLGKFNKGETTNMFYRLYIPKELRNAFALSETRTKWVWTARLEDASKPSDKPSRSGGGGSHSGPHVKETPPTPVPNPENNPSFKTEEPPAPDGGVQGTGRGLSKTGQQITFFFLILAGMFGIFAIILRKRKGDHHGEN